MIRPPPIQTRLVREASTQEKNLLVCRAIGIPYAFKLLACMAWSFHGPCSLLHFKLKSVLRTWQSRHGTVLSPKVPLPWRAGPDVPAVWSEFLAMPHTPLSYDPMPLANVKQAAMLSRSPFVSLRESRCCLPL